MENQGSNPNGGDGRDESPLALRRNETGQALVPAQPQHALIDSRPRETEADGDEIDLSNYLRIFLRRKWWIVGAALVGFALAGFITLLQTPIYRATATIQIQDRADQVVNVGALNQPGQGGWGAMDFMGTQLDLIRSRSLAERVAADLGLQESGELDQLRPPTAWQRLLSMVAGGAEEAGTEDDASGNSAADTLTKTVKSLASGLKVAQKRNSELAEISYESPSEEFAVRSANAFADGYLSSNIERRFDSSAYAKTYLEERLEELKIKLQDSERELVEFAQKEGIVGTRGEAATLSEQNLDSINATLSEARAERVKAEARWRQAQASTGAVVAGMIGTDSIIRTLQENRSKMQAEYQTKIATFKPEFPAMLELKAQIDELDRQIEAEVASIKNALKAEFDGAMAQEATLVAMLDSMKDEVLDLRGRSIQYDILKREVDTNRELYDGLLQRYKEIGVAAGVSANNISVVDRAAGAYRVKPNPLLNLSFGLLVGLALGVFSAIAIEHFDDTVKTPEDIETKLGMVNLGSVPKLGKDETPATAAADMRSAFAESYRSIRTALQFSTESGIPAVLAITSTTPGEGKSTTSLTLARNLAMLGKRVLLIDGDMRNPSLHKVLGIENGVGLSNCLAGGAKPGEAVRQLEGEAFSILTCGPLPPNPSELLAGARMVSLLAQAAERYDHVLIDSPPVIGLADAPIIANMAHGTLLIVEAGRARVSAVQASVKRLRSARARLLGAVLTKFDARHGGYGYGAYKYMSYDYYSYGSKEPKRLFGKK